MERGACFVLTCVCVCACVCVCVCSLMRMAPATGQVSVSSPWRPQLLYASGANKQTKARIMHGLAATQAS